MSDRDLILRAILTSPEEDVPRLMFADWLDENGAVLWAALIRQHYELEERGFGRRVYMHRCGEPALYVSHLSPKGWELAPAMTGVSWGVSRGFVSEIHLPCAAFLEHAKGIFSAHPVTRVVLTDRRPEPNPLDMYTDETDGFYLQTNQTGRSLRKTGIMVNDDRRHVPVEIFELMRGHRDARPHCDHNRYYATEQEGFDDLSFGCVAYGRAAAGLPPLPTPKAGAA